MVHSPIAAHPETKTLAALPLSACSPPQRSTATPGQAAWPAGGAGCPGLAERSPAALPPRRARPAAGLGLDPRCLGCAWAGREGGCNVLPPLIGL